ncbi:L-serine ammonia-lyase [Arcobacter roscoffensis]|uniref:L-serine dehydratase n=1 Tax=Arcobacter roscoffensis TaxID=2961520 RepID=A0ABY5E877_9BACT|nr:L-serine ammonia-lyase [Arcobacter roscoffensis]UTJ06956.1 L-serine ammonia-lyase [Arcobacter roscoffensis]
MTIFNLFKIGIGPSSSHTVGPMLIAKRFVDLIKKQNHFSNFDRIKIELFGSLGATGIGHHSNSAVLLGLMGNEPKTVDTNTINQKIDEIKSSSKIKLLDEKKIDFSYENDLILYTNKTLDFHPNAIKLSIYKNETELFCKTYYSIGGGEVISEDEIDSKKSNEKTLPYDFASAKELLQKAKENNLSISQLILENEKVYKSEENIKKDLLEIWNVMKGCVSQGLKGEGFLPGGLKVPKRAFNIHQKLKAKVPNDPLAIVDWINLYALAVNEENASGSRVVTAPTNGASGIIPAVLHYITNFLNHKNEEEVVINFLLTAGAIGLLYQKNASISGADVGCQGEVGVACSMAAAGMASYLGANIKQVENAAEIAMEHNLGLTCDPIGGLVQIPCIERNAMAAMKAVNAARMAINEDGKHYVSLDSVIKTMYDTGKDMQNKYKETSMGGLAVNYIEC